MTSFESILLIAALVLLGPVTLVSFLNLVGWRRIKSSHDAGSGQVSVLIPARNEELTLADCVESVVQQGDVIAEILIYNDRSTDRTEDVVVGLVDAHQRLVRQVETRPLKTGWVGKPHACAQLAEEASAKWMLFLDADARLEPGAVGRLLHAADSTEATFVSAWPVLEMKSFAERLLMPLLNFVVFTLFPAPISRSQSGASLGLAHGACILAERETYRATGGHELVKDRLFEDTAFARSWRGHGENSQVVDGSGIVRVRMYEDFSGIWNGFTKNYFPAFKRTTSFFLFQAYMAITYLVLPVLALVAVSLSGVAPWIAAIAGAVFVPRLLIALRFGHPLWSVLLHPVAVLLMLALGFNSWWASTRGDGVAWKGRVYNASGLVVSDE